MKKYLLSFLLLPILLSSCVIIIDKILPDEIVSYYQDIPIVKPKKQDFKATKMYYGDDDVYYQEYQTPPGVIYSPIDSTIEVEPRAAFRNGMRYRRIQNGDSLFFVYFHGYNMLPKEDEIDENKFYCLAYDFNTNSSFTIAEIMYNYGSEEYVYFKEPFHIKHTTYFDLSISIDSSYLNTSFRINFYLITLDKITNKTFNLDRMSVDVISQGGKFILNNLIP